MTRVALDASNLRVGGGIQVAASLVDEMYRLRREPESSSRWPWLASMHICVSPEVARQLGDHVPRSELKVIASKFAALTKRANADVLLTVFGPTYRRPKSQFHIMGCADVTTLYPNPEGVPRPGWPLRAKAVVRRLLARRSFASAEVIVAETGAIRDRAVAALGIEPSRVAVIENTINGIFLERDRWLPLAREAMPASLEIDSNVVRLAYVSRLYPHKNFPFLGRLARELTVRHGVALEFLLTLRPTEWQKLDPLTRSRSFNVGELDVGQIPTLLSLSDGVIFPSLLEAFSAAPLEAMAMGVPLYASDRDFVRTSCGTYPVYIDPLDHRGAASSIAAALNSERDWRMSPPGLHSARDRAVEYLELIDAAVRGTGV